MNFTNPRKYLFLLLIFAGFIFTNLIANTGRYRLTWQDDPSTTMVIGWDQISGQNPRVYFDVVNHGPIPDKFAFSKAADEPPVAAKGMTNYFVTLNGLRPNTVYYFLINDTDGASEVFSFRTAPNRSADRLSIIAGSDSRNHRDARVDANKLVGKLRPHAVLFGGDFTENDSDEEWRDWFDDWQYSISKDGRMTPIVVARGNHEYSNRTLIELFNIQDKNITYALSFGGDLLRVYTLNSMIASGGDQKIWLHKDLAANPQVTWKFAQYHLSTKPHTRAKESKNDQWENWSTLFYEYGLDLAIESDAHVVKSTYPLRPSVEPGSEEGFIRDDATGTVYIGEGCWGAPLRRNDDNKSWTRASGSFNCFHWIFVGEDKVEIRFVKTDGADYVADIDPNNIFQIPRGLNIWNPETGDVIEILKDREFDVVDFGDELVARGPADFDIFDFELSVKGPDVLVTWKTENEPGNLRYELQRSVGGAEFESLEIIAGKGVQLGDYSFLDRNVAAKYPGKFVNYRIRQIDANGKEMLFEMPPASRGNPKGPAIRQGSGPRSETPEINNLLVDSASGQLLVKFFNPAPGTVTIRLLNLQDGIVRKWELPGLKPGENLKSLDCNGIKKGKYGLVITANKKLVQKFRVFVN